MCDICVWNLLLLTLSMTSKKLPLQKEQVFFFKKKCTVELRNTHFPPPTIKRKHHQSKYSGFTPKCKPLVSIKTRKTRLVFARNKSLYSSGTSSYGETKPRSTFTELQEEKKYGLIGWSFTVQMDNDVTHILKLSQVKKQNALQQPSHHKT